MPVRPILLHGPSFLSTVLQNFGQLGRIFWASGLPPPLAKNCPYAYGEYSPSPDVAGHLSLDLVDLSQNYQSKPDDFDH